MNERKQCNVNCFNLNAQKYFILFLAFESETLEMEVPEWIIDLADDLDVLIALRHFEEANSLIKKAKQYLEDFNSRISSSIEQEIKYLFYITCFKFYEKLNL